MNTDSTVESACLSILARPPHCGTRAERVKLSCNWAWRKHCMKSYRHSRYQLSWSGGNLISILILSNLCPLVSCLVHIERDIDHVAWGRSCDIPAGDVGSFTSLENDLHQSWNFNWNRCQSAMLKCRLLVYSDEAKFNKVLCVTTCCYRAMQLWDIVLSNF